LQINFKRTILKKKLKDMIDNVVKTIKGRNHLQRQQQPEDSTEFNLKLGTLNNYQE